jgi:hypothetical protein
VARRIRSGDVLDQLYELFLRRGMPEYKPQQAREMARLRIIGEVKQALKELQLKAEYNIGDK